MGLARCRTRKWSSVVSYLCLISLFGAQQPTLTACSEARATVNLSRQPSVVRHSNGPRATQSSLARSNRNADSSADTPNIKSKPVRDRPTSAFVGGRRKAVSHLSTAVLLMMALIKRYLTPPTDTLASGRGDDGGVYGDKPILRGQFHKYGAILYPPLLGLPLYLHAINSHCAHLTHNLPLISLLFNAAMETIMVVSATLHTFPWKTNRCYNIARKLDFTAIFVGIALFYSSLGKLLLGDQSELFSKIEICVWVCAFAGGAMKWVVPDAPAFVNAGIFLIQGWAVLPLVPTLFRTATREEAIGLFSGGVFVTLGALAYSFQWPTFLSNRRKSGSDSDRRKQSDVLFGPHEMFHVGTLLMFISFWYTMWMAII